MHRVTRTKAALSVALALVALASVGADEAVAQWPQFRGPNSGVADDDPALPDVWSEQENVAWRVDVPGSGWSSPVVWGEHVIVTAAIASEPEAKPIKGLYDPGDDQGKMASTTTHRWMVYDFDFASGALRWQRELRSGRSAVMRHIKNTFASETPVTDGQRVYVYFGSIGLVAALDMTGAVAWTKDVGAFDGRQAFGTAASPALHGDQLFVVHDNTTQSFLVSLDARTGAERWKVTREEVENWSSPFVWTNELRTEVVTAGMGRIRSYGLDGAPLWEVKGMTVNTVPTPFARHGLVYVSSGYPGANPRPVYAIRPGASGDISLQEGETRNQYIAWYQPLLGTYNTSSLAYGDNYYTLLDRGFLLCHDARTGEQLYGRQRLSPESAGFTASPWAYNGKVFLLSEDGDTFVVQAGTRYTLLGKNSLNEMTLATPAIARGSLFIRTQTKLYRIARGK